MPIKHIKYIISIKLNWNLNFFPPNSLKWLSFFSKCGLLLIRAPKRETDIFLLELISKFGRTEIDVCMHLCINSCEIATMLFFYWQNDKPQRMIMWFCCVFVFIFMGLLFCEKRLAIGRNFRNRLWPHAIWPWTFYFVC